MVFILKTSVFFERQSYEKLFAAFFELWSCVHCFATLIGATLGTDTMWELSRTTLLAGNRLGWLHFKLFTSAITSIMGMSLLWKGHSILPLPELFNAITLSVSAPFGKRTRLIDSIHSPVREHMDK